MTTTSFRVDLPIGLVSADEVIVLASGISAQACRATVRWDDQETRVTLLLVGAGERPLDAKGRAALAEREPAGTEVVGVELSGSGAATVDASGVPETAIRAVAAAAGVCAASWGWDESATIQVHMNGLAWTVRPTHGAGAWLATVADPRQEATW